MKRLISILLTLSFISCGYDKFEEHSNEIPSVDLLPNADLSILWDNYFGGNVTIKEPMVFEGYVTANDRSGNMYQSFTIQDITGAVEVYAGFGGQHTLLKEGRRVIVSAEGLAVGAYNGVIQIGRRVNSYSDYKVEGFGTQAVLDCYVHRDSILREVTPVHFSIADLNRRDCGKLIKIGPVCIDSEYNDSFTWAFSGDVGSKPSTGVRRFRDSEDNYLDVVTSGYASFAHKSIPGDSIILTGILLYGKFGGGSERFGLKIRDIDDVEIY